VKIYSSDDTKLIRPDGKVKLPKTAATVMLVLEVTRTSDGTKALTNGIEVVVPAKKDD
jgi:hypothetical protein